MSNFGLVEERPIIVAAVWFNVLLRIMSIMSSGDVVVAAAPVFVAWEEQVICQERGNRVIHFYLKDASGNSVLAVVGTERSVRHMMYVVHDQFVKAYGSTQPINAFKWRARREVVDWLTCLVSRNHPHHAGNLGFDSVISRVSGFWMICFL